MVYVWTHDSIGLGEDGPTHQPVEQLMSLRAMPNIDVVRPCDANESAAAWRHAMARSEGPTALVLSRQNLPVLDGAGAGLARGAYVLRDHGDVQVILCATGSEVEIAIAAQELLAERGVGSRVVSMPCWELFERQDAAYRDEVLPPSVRPRVAVEAGVTFGWERWIGRDGIAVGVDHFGASAPAEELYEHFGLTPAKVAEAAERAMSAAK